MTLTSEMVVDPVQFAQWAMDTYVGPTYEVETNKLCPSETEIAQWEITYNEIALWRCEIPLMAATGVAITVAKNLSYEYYEAFVRALCGRLVRMLYGHYSTAYIKDVRDTIELYVSYLESGDDAFPFYYLKRIFSDNTHQEEMIQAQLWRRAADVLMQTLAASRQALVEVSGGKG